jgi:hypothetical protein
LHQDGDQMSDAQAFFNLVVTAEPLAVGSHS